LVSRKTITRTEFDSYDQSYVLIEIRVNHLQLARISAEWFAQADDRITLARGNWRRRGSKAVG
jgi:hypothetical protein